MALTACAGIEPQGLSNGWGSFTEERISVASVAFNECTPVRLNYTDAWQAEQYSLFQADGRQMEMVYARTNKAVTVALDYRMPLVKMASTWALNSGQSLYWGPLGRIDHHPLGIFFTVLTTPENAAAIASGSVKNSGNPGFPFRFARYYTENGGSKIR
jgi:hypothetical protein